MPKFFKQTLPSVVGVFNPTLGKIAEKAASLNLPSMTPPPDITTVKKTDMGTLEYRREWAQRNPELAQKLGIRTKTRRKRPRLTGREIQELLILKQVVGTRSPLLTIAGMRMLSRGG